MSNSYSNSHGFDDSQSLSVEEKRLIEDVDVRNFRKSAHTMSYMGYAVDKTIQGSISKLKKGSNDQSSLASSQSIGTIESIKEIDIFLMNCWDIFQKYSQKFHGTHSTSKKTIDISQLRDALLDLTPKGQESLLNNVIRDDYNHQIVYQIGWKDFKTICLRLFKLLGNKNQSTSIYNTSLLLGNQPNQHPKSSYQSIVDSQSLSSVDLEETNSLYGSVNMNMPPEERYVSVHKDAQVAVIRNEARKSRRQYQEHNLIPKSKHDHTNENTDNQPHYQQNIEKNVLQNMIRSNSNSSHFSKWRKMNKQRDREDRQISLREKRKDVMTLFTTIVNAQDRNNLNDALMNLEERDRDIVTANMTQRKFEDDLRKSTIQLRKETDYFNKSMSAQDLKASLRTASTETRRLVKEEKVDKRFTLGDTSTMSLPKLLSPESSTRIHVPNELLDKVKYARRLSDYKNAKKEAKDYYEHEISRRIGNYVKSRQSAVAKSEGYGCKINILPLKGSDYFEGDVVEEGPSSYCITADSKLEYGQSFQHLNLNESTWSSNSFLRPPFHQTR